MEKCCANYKCWAHYNNEEAEAKRFHTCLKMEDVDEYARVINQRAYVVSWGSLVAEREFYCNEWEDKDNEQKQVVSSRI